MDAPTLRHVVRPWAVVGWACLLAASGPGWAQSHAVTDGPFTLRSSTVASESLLPASAKEHGVKRAADVGVVNVTVERRDAQGGTSTVPAKVKVETRSLTGRTAEVPVKETRANNYISYLGTYSFLPREVVDITVTAVPAGEKKALKLTYRDQMQAPDAK